MQEEKLVQMKVVQRDVSQLIYILLVYSHYLAQVKYKGV